MHFHRHVGSVCSTVVWRLSVNFNKNMDSVFHSHVEGLCAFPRASGKCTFNSHVEALCAIPQACGQCLFQLCGGFV